jgi:hypothetical protein
MIELNVCFSLKDESSFWIINRVNDSLDEYTTIIKIKKEKGSQRLYLNLGTYVKDIHGNLIFRIFHKQQLVDFGMRAKGYVENDYSDIKMIILDREDRVDIDVFSNICLI